MAESKNRCYSFTTAYALSIFDLFFGVWRIKAPGTALRGDDADQWTINPLVFAPELRPKDSFQLSGMPGNPIDHAALFSVSESVKALLTATLATHSGNADTIVEKLLDRSVQHVTKWTVVSVDRVLVVLSYTSQVFTACTSDSTGSRVGVYSCAT